MTTNIALGQMKLKIFLNLSSLFLLLFVLSSKGEKRNCGQVKGKAGTWARIRTRARARAGHET